MAFDPVPLAIGGGAVHSDDVMRVAANIFSRDSAGIRRPGDFKVTATGSPSGTVNIAPGGMVLPNVQKPGQSYVGHAPTLTTESRSLTQAGNHLIVARIIDPEFSPWQPSGTPGAPNTSVANGPYFEPHVIPGVSATTTLAEQVVTYTAEALALVKNPTGAAAITNEMIVDLRRLAQPRIGFAFDVQQGAPLNFVTVSEINWHDWPLNSLSVYVPRWATHAQVMVGLHNVAVDAPCDVNLRAVLGNLVGPTSFFDYNGNAGTGVGFVETRPHMLYAEFDVRAHQGQTLAHKTQAKRDYVAGAEHVGSNNGNVWYDPYQQTVFDVRFSERVV